ncbi:MAG: response regulator [Candidatus Falkowbacteria bacterium]
MANDKQKKVLIVEDEEILRAMYERKFVQDKELKVFIAADGAEGLEMAKREKPDVVLLDIILPKLDGFSVLEEIRKIKEMKKTPIFMFTNLGTPEDIEKGKALGATDYMVKVSLTPDQIYEKVKKYLKK